MENVVASVETFREQLYSLASPVIYQRLNAMYFMSTAENAEEPIKQFQHNLKGISSWDKETVVQEARHLSDQSGSNYLDKLLIRILSDEAKILTQGRYVAMDYPSLNEYVHRIYVECAKLFYVYPHLFYKKGISSYDAHRNFTSAMNIIQKAIHASIRYFLPMEDILDSTLEIDDARGFNNLEDAYEDIDLNTEEEVSEESEEDEAQEDEAQEEKPLLEEPQEEVVFFDEI